MATKRANNARRDFTQVALFVVQQATGEATAPTLSKKQESGRKGGLVGGVARATGMTQARRSEIARLAAQARWKKSS